jgi:cell division septal protein FtsQ
MGRNYSGSFFVRLGLPESGSVSEKKSGSNSMKKRARVIFWIVITLAVIAGLVYWQMYKLSKGLRTIKVGGVLVEIRLTHYRLPG